MSSPSQDLHLVRIKLQSSNDLSQCSIDVMGHNSSVPLGAGVNVLLYVPGFWSNNNFVFHCFDLVSSVDNANKLEEYIDSLPPQVLVIMISAGNIPLNNFTTGVRNALHCVGSIKVSEDFTGGCNFCLIGSKGSNIGNALESVSNSSTELATLDQKVHPRFHSNIISITLNSTSQFIYRNGMQLYVPIGPGLNVVTFDQNMHFLSSTAFNTGSSDTDCSYLIRHLNGLQQEVLVVMFSNGDIQQHLSSDAIAVIKTFGSNFIDRLNQNDLWYLIGRKERQNPFSEYSTSSSGTISGRYYSTGDEGSSSYRLALGSGRKYTSVHNYSVVGDNLTTNTTTQQTDGLLVTVVDDVTGIPMLSQVYPTSKKGIRQVCDLLFHKVAIGAIVMVSGSNCDISNFNSSPLIPAIESLGSNLIRKFKGGDDQVFAMIGRKGASKGSIPEVLSSDSATSLSADFDYNKRFTRPYIEIHARSVGQNVPSGTNNTTEIRLNQVIVPMNYTIGLNVLVIDQNTGNILINQTYDTHSSSDASVQFTTMISSLPNGRSVVIVVNQDAITSLSSDAKATIQSLGSQYINSVQIGDSWSLIGVVGGDASAISECHSTTQPTSCESWLMVKSLYPTSDGVNVSVHSCGKLTSSGPAGMSMIYFDGQQVNMIYGSGLNVVVFNPTVGREILLQNNYNTVASSANGDLFATMIRSLPFGCTVIIAVKDSIGQLTPKALNAFKCIGVEGINLLSQYGSLTVIGTKGFSQGSILENYSNDSPSSIQLWVPLIVLPMGSAPEVLDLIFGLSLVLCLFAFTIISSAYYVEATNYSHSMQYLHSGYTTNFTQAAYTGPRVVRQSKRALLIGINYKNTVNVQPLVTDREGGLTDSVATVKSTRKRLIRYGYFNSSDIKILYDDDRDPNEEIRPTKNNVLKELEWLTSDLQRGDVILFLYFGHGIREPIPAGLPNKNSYSVPPYEKSCMVTLSNTNYPYARDVLYVSIFQNAFSNVPAGVNVTWIMNYCFAGGAGKNIPSSSPLNQSLITFNSSNEDYPTNFKFNMLKTLNDELQADITYQDLYNKTYNQLKEYKVKAESNYPQPYQQMNQLNKTGKNLSTLKFLSPII